VTREEPQNSTATDETVTQDETAEENQQPTGSKVRREAESGEVYDATNDGIETSQTKTTLVRVKSASTLS
jgi:hypothetical protein